MPARMIRESLLDSDRFLGLPDNTARVCYVAVLLKADDRGNMEASPAQLVRIWRDFGVDSNTKASSIAQTLADVDLVRMYQSDDKAYLHIPRFGQRLRHLKKAACPPSPWDGIQEKQQGDQKNDGRTAGERQASDGRPSAEVKRSEEKNTKGASAFVLPDWISPGDWDAFEESRKKLRKPMTDRARTLVLTELARLRDAGHDPTAVLAQSIRKGWQDVFPLKDSAKQGFVV